MEELDSPRKAEVDEAPTHGLKLAKIVSKGNSEGDSPQKPAKKDLIFE